MAGQGTMCTRAEVIAKTKALEVHAPQKGGGHEPSGPMGVKVPKN